MIVTITLDMGVDNDDHLATLGGNVLLHDNGVGECSIVPCEVSLSISVLNIQPDNIISFANQRKRR